MVAHQSGPMKMNNTYRPLHTKCGQKKSAVTSQDYSLRILHSYGNLWGIWCKLRLREDRGENPLGLKVCSRSTDEAENQNRGVVQRRSAVWKSPPDSGTVDSDWYGLCFNLAQFTLHYSWHVLGCVNFVLISPDMFVCIPHVYHTRERESNVQVYAMETPRELLKCIRNVRKIKQLLCRSANLSFCWRICLMSTHWKAY